jgi:hypothetical protein
VPRDADTPLDQWDFEDPNEELFFAIAWCERPGVSGDFPARIRSAHARGADLDRPNEDEETPLTEAILGGEGSPEAVRVLLELGADPSRSAPSGWTPWTACQDRLEDRVVRERMEQIQTLLAASGADRTGQAPAGPVHEEFAKPERPADIPAKYAPLYEQGTNGINCDLTTADVVAVLIDWDERFGVEISEIGHDRVVVAFRSLPDDADAVDALAREIYTFCPDVVEQGFGCLGEMIEMSEETGREVPPEVRVLVEGIDFDDDDSGIEILKRDLVAQRVVRLWWD